VGDLMLDVWRKLEMCKEFLSTNFKVERPLGSLGVGGRIILERV
jgi:hypothetical protein